MMTTARNCIREGASLLRARRRVPIRTPRISSSSRRPYSQKSDPGVKTMDEELSRLNELLDKFKDPSSHYHIPPGANGPQHEEDHTTSRDPSTSSIASSSSTSTPSINSNTGQGDEFGLSRMQGIEFFKSEGYDSDPRGILEWPVAWGDCDMFQHVNNVRFVRWVETARIRYAESLNLPKGQIQGMMSGKGTGFILKSVSLKYIRPVTWPDTVMIASLPHRIQQDRSCFDLKHAIWSLKDKRLAAVADSTMVLYDYDRLVKGSMTDEFRRALEARIP